jgi:hypothetical protein
VTELERISAIEDIRACKARYARGADSQNWELFGSAFAIDAVWDLSGFAIARTPKTREWNSIGSEFDLAFLENFSNLISWPKIGRDEIASGACDIMGDVVASFHRLFNPEIAVISATTASAIWPFEETIQFREQSDVAYMNGMGYYHETYTKYDQSWLIQTCSLQRVIFNIG